MKMPSFIEEKKLWHQGYKYVAGVDEAGRGAWAGPLVAAAVILPVNFDPQGIRDSKQLTPHQREVFFDYIVSQAVSLAIYKITPAVIDKHGLNKGNLKALAGSVKKLSVRPRAVLVDGFQIKIRGTYVRGVIKGDEKIVSVAAASIIAKVFRDGIMRRYAIRYPQYGFEHHKGYGTNLHRQNLLRFGPLPIHRKSYFPVSSFF